MGVDDASLGSRQRPLRIALVAPYDISVPGGVTKHVIGLARQLLHDGHDVTLMAPCSAPQRATDDLDFQGSFVNLSTKVWAVPYSGAVSHISVDPRAWWRLRRCVARPGFDVIHVHEPLAPGIPWAVLAWARRARPALLVGTFHAMREGHSRLYAWTHRLWEQRMHVLDGRIAVSQTTADFWNRYLPVRFRLIPNGVDPAYFSNAVPPDSDDDVLFLGRLEPRKGLRVLLRAWALVESQHLTARLTVAGSYTAADAARYRGLLRELGLQRVRFSGPVPESELLATYRRAAVVCAPATGFESFGLVVLEAMAAGRAVVASDISGFRTLLTQGEQGILTPPECPQALASALLRLLCNPQDRDALGARGRQTARAYGWDVVAPRVLDFYNELHNELRSGLGSELHNELHNELRSGLGSELHNELGNELHSELGNELHSELGNELRGERQSDLGNEPDLRRNR